MDIRRRSVVLAIVLVMLMPSIAMAEAPANDTFGTATVVSSLPYTQAIDLTEATEDASISDCETDQHHRIWYRYTPPVDQVIRVSSGVTDEEPRTEFAVWDVTDGDPSEANLVDCAAQRHDLSVALDGGRSYAFVVGQHDAGPPWFSGTLTVEVVQPPPNDAFADAALIGDGDSIQIDLGTSLAASKESGEPTASCANEETPDTGTLWYRFTVDGPSTATVSTQVSTLATVFSGSTLDSLTELACVDERATTLDIGPGTYHIQVRGRPFLAQGMILSLDLTVPPANDDFADATTIGSVPYLQTEIDFTLASVEPDEPTTCSTSNPATAWWTYTAAAKGRLTFQGSGYAVGAFSGSALGSLTQLGCTFFGSTSVSVNPGDVIHLQLAGPNLVGPFSIQADFAPAPANDDFADAATISDLPFDAELDLSTTSLQQNEPTPSCYGANVTTLWYRFVATGPSTTFSFDPTFRQAALAAYTGTSLDGLTQIGCASSGPAQLFTIKPAAGTIVWIQVAMADSEFFRQVAVHAAAAGNPVVDFFPTFNDPSIYSDLSFFDVTNDPGGATHTVTWTFGDGSTSTDQFPVHRYAKDGDYTVTLTVVTADGRTGSATRTVQVRTHDVEIVAFDVPASVKAGQTKTITVSIANKRYREVGSVWLSAIRPGGFWEFVEQRTGVAMPVTHGAKTTDITFKYRFTRADAEAGKVSFRVLVFADGVNDVAMGDNEIIATPTRVTR